MADLRGDRDDALVIIADCRVSASFRRVAFCAFFFSLLSLDDCMASFVVVGLGFDASFICEVDSVFLPLSRLLSPLGVSCLVSDLFFSDIHLHYCPPLSPAQN